MSITNKCIHNNTKNSGNVQSTTTAECRCFDGNGTSINDNDAIIDSTTDHNDTASTTTTTTKTHNNHYDNFGNYQPYRIRYTAEQVQIYQSHVPTDASTESEMGTRPELHADICKTTNGRKTDSNDNNNKVIVVDPSHYQPMGTWTLRQINDQRRQHSFAGTWQPNSIRHSLPYLTHGEGIYLYSLDAIERDEEIAEDKEDNSGSNDCNDTLSNFVLPTVKGTKRYIDWTSQAVCANLGHSIPQQILSATIQQMQTIPYIYSGLGVTEIRIRLNALLNESILPEPLVVAVYPNSGAEANEAGILLARRYTQRTKILSLYRSYHGATFMASSVTGDYRRWYNEPYQQQYDNTADTHFVSSSSSHQFLKAFHPFPLFFQYSGTTPSEQVISALHMLEEQIIHEGPYNIASIVMESIIGAGGCCIYPSQYIHGIRAICNKYGILLHFDEIMVGFGRTGMMFGFQHYHNVVPDIVTAAKGITCAYVPLSMMACRKDILDHFETIPLGWGSTYESHPVALATAYETIKYILQNNTLQHVQSVSSTFRSEMERLAAIHPCIKQYRAIGLFGCFDVHDMDGYHPKLPCEDGNESTGNVEAYQKYIRAYDDNGLIGLHRYPHIHCAPPLIISNDELYDGFQRLHQALLVLDDALGYH